MYNQLPTKRYNNTLKFLKEILPAPAIILDLGVRNPFSEIMEKNGYTVYNTNGEDLDILPEIVNKYKVDAITSFEVFEHLLNPYSILKEIDAKYLITSVPLSLWFSRAYRSKVDLRDRHYHEFEDWQFDWLLEKTGWKILKRQKWTSPINKIGIRPILRLFTKRYYIVYAVKTNL